MGRTAKRDETSSRYASNVPATFNRPLLMSDASSHRVIAEIAIPPERSALRIADFACLDNFAGSKLSQPTMWVSSKITL
jgi:hypothetical protein